MPPDWKPLSRPRPEALLRLVCFAHAGGSATFFYAWARHLPLEIDVLPMELPGHWARLEEPPVADAGALGAAAAASLAPILDLGPYALVGYSMGTLVAFETARALRRRGAPPPAHLVFAARFAPDRPMPPGFEIDLAWSDEALLEHVATRYGGMPDTLRNDPRVYRRLVHMLRADGPLIAQYQCGAEAPFDVSITAIGGRDDALLRAEPLDSWRHHTTADCAVRLFAGKHFFVNEDAPAVMRYLETRLAAWL